MPKRRMSPRSTTMRMRSDVSSKIRSHTLLLWTFHCTIEIYKASEAYWAGCERSRRISYWNKNRCQYKARPAFCAYRSFIVCDEPHNLEPFRINLRGRFPLPAAPAMIKVRMSIRQLALPHLKSTPPRSVLTKFSLRPRLPRMDGYQRAYLYRIILKFFINRLKPNQSSLLSSIGRAPD
jgi:hypothetical protein